MQLLKLLYRNGVQAHPKATQPNPEYVPVDIHHTDEEEIHDDDTSLASPSVSTPSAYPPHYVQPSGRRSRRSRHMRWVYNTRWCDFMENILKRTDPEQKLLLRKKLMIFLVLENIMLKQPESVFDCVYDWLFEIRTRIQPYFVEVCKCK